MPGAKGQSHKKLPKAKRDEIDNLVLLLLGKGKTPGEVKRMIEANYGLKRRSVEPYIRRAREAMREATGQSLEDHRADSYHFYQSILQDKNASVREKLKARELIDKLLGLPKPVMVHGKNLNLNLSNEDLKGMSDEELDEYERRVLAATSD